MCSTLHRPKISEVMLATTVISDFQSRKHSPSLIDSGRILVTSVGRKQIALNSNRTHTRTLTHRYWNNKKLTQKYALNSVPYCEYEQLHKELERRTLFYRRRRKNHTHSTPVYLSPRVYPPTPIQFRSISFLVPMWEEARNSQFPSHLRFRLISFLLYHRRPPCANTHCSYYNTTNGWWTGSEDQTPAAGGGSTH